MSLHMDNQWRLRGLGLIGDALKYSFKIKLSVSTQCMALFINILFYFIFESNWMFISILKTIMSSINYVRLSTFQDQM